MVRPDRSKPLKPTELALIKQNPKIFTRNPKRSRSRRGTSNIVKSFNEEMDRISQYQKSRKDSTSVISGLIPKKNSGNYYQNNMKNSFTMSVSKSLMTDQGHYLHNRNFFDNKEITDNQSWVSNLNLQKRIDNQNHSLRTSGGLAAKIKNKKKHFKDDKNSAQWLRDSIGMKRLNSDTQNKNTPDNINNKKDGDNKVSYADLSDTRKNIRAKSKFVKDKNGQIIENVQTRGQIHNYNAKSPAINESQQSSVIIRPSDARNKYVKPRGVLKGRVQYPEGQKPHYIQRTNQGGNITYAGNNVQRSISTSHYDKYKDANNNANNRIKENESNNITSHISKGTVGGFIHQKNSQGNVRTIYGNNKQRNDSEAFVQKKALSHSPVLRYKHSNDSKVYQINQKDSNLIYKTGQIIKSEVGTNNANHPNYNNHTILRSPKNKNISSGYKIEYNSPNHINYSNPRTDHNNVINTPNNISTFKNHEFKNKNSNLVNHPKLIYSGYVDLQNQTSKLERDSIFVNEYLHKNKSGNQDDNSKNPHLNLRIKGRVTDNAPNNDANRFDKNSITGSKLDNHGQQSHQKSQISYKIPDSFKNNQSHNSSLQVSEINNTFGNSNSNKHYNQNKIIESKVIKKSLTQKNTNYYRVNDPSSQYNNQNRVTNKNLHQKNSYTQRDNVSNNSQYNNQNRVVNKVVYQKNSHANTDNVSNNSQYNNQHKITGKISHRKNSYVQRDNVSNNSQYNNRKDSKYIPSNNNSQYNNQTNETSHKQTDHSREYINRTHQNQNQSFVSNHNSQYNNQKYKKQYRASNTNSQYSNHINRNTANLSSKNIHEDTNHSKNKISNTTTHNNINYNSSNSRSLSSNNRVPAQNPPGKTKTYKYSYKQNKSQNTLPIHNPTTKLKRNNKIARTVRKISSNVISGKNTFQRGNTKETSVRKHSRNYSDISGKSFEDVSGKRSDNRSVLSTQSNTKKSKFVKEIDGYKLLRYGERIKE